MRPPAGGGRAGDDRAGSGFSQYDHASVESSRAMSAVAFTCLPAAVGLWMLVAPARYVMLAVNGLPFLEGWRNPRGACKVVSSDLQQRFEAVHLNAGEGLPLLFGAVLAAVVAGVPDAEVDAVAVRYLWSRVAYTVVYLASSPKRRWLGLVRTGCFAVGFFSLVGLFMSAAEKRGK